MPTVANIQQRAIEVAQSLADQDDDALYVLIGKQDKAITREPVLAFDAALNPAYDTTHMGLVDDLKAVGRRIVNTWAHALHSLVCGEKGDKGDDAARQQLFSAIGLGEAAAIGAVTTLLLPVLSPPIAAAASVVIVKRFLLPAGKDICDFWGEQLDAAKG